MYKGGNTYQLITDHLGSIRLVVDVATGIVAQKIDYDEYGNVLSNTNPDFQPFAYAGGLYDNQSKLTRFGARDYDASAGRWLAKDPILFKGGIGNLYSYVGGDPINRIDPFGLQHWEYSQRSGNLTYVDRNGVRTPHGTGYSGRGDGLNNPAMQHMENIGPIPQGTYSVGPQQNITTRDNRTLQNAMRLTPDAATQAYLNRIGRGGFIMHGGDFEEMDSSTGCPVIRPNERNNVARSGANELRVVP